MKIWVPRRSSTKATWPGMLDNVSLFVEVAEYRLSLVVFPLVSLLWNPWSRSATKRHRCLKVLCGRI